ncbi:MAG: hypothetical protein M1826_004792 [Phylliscum demangeonii]|nr:MAG: hypothetical protein M1826_004792 [Phylliscum demangeonii]
MIAIASKKHGDSVRPPPPLHTVSDYGPVGAGLGLVPAGNVTGVQNPSVIYHHIQELSAKRISTLEYLRKAHDGRLYWFNTLYFDKQDLSKMSSFDSKKLARRATNYFLLGLSIPSLSEISSQNPLDYLRSLYALLVEFDAYQQMHPADGSSGSSLSRARIPSMFKRATHGASGKGRRASSATEIGLPIGTGADPSEIRSMAGGIASTASSGVSSIPANDHELVGAGEGYAYLSTPFLPFDPDFFETFTTLCEVLVDCYTRVMTLANTPLMCPQPVGDIFAKADAKIRKIIIAGIVKDFEEASRSGVKAELGGVGKVVFGGLL